jgi:putative flippase GtrA
MIATLVKRHGVSLMAYVLIGGASALVEWSVFWVLVRVASVHYLLAAVLAFMVSTFCNYLLCVRTIFVSKTQSSLKDLAAVYAASLLGLAVNLAMLAILAKGFGVNLMLAKIAGTGAAFFFNFASRQFVIFSPNFESALNNTRRLRDQGK